MFSKNDIFSPQSNRSLYQCLRNTQMSGIKRNSLSHKNMEKNYGIYKGTGLKLKLVFKLKQHMLWKKLVKCVSLKHSFFHNREKVKQKEFFVSWWCFDQVCNFSSEIKTKFPSSPEAGHCLGYVGEGGKRS